MKNIFIINNNLYLNIFMEDETIIKIIDFRRNKRSSIQIFRRSKMLDKHSSDKKMVI